MNERIRELAEQAGFGSAWFEESLPGYPALPKEGMLKEFAELIVRECINTMASEIVYNDNYKEKNKTISDMTELLKEHFGVEE